MDCREFIDRLDAVLEGRLIEGERREAEEHLQGCARCRELHALFGGGPGHLAIEAPAGLAEAILERTSGPACASARERLCDHVDRLLEPVEEELVRAHVRSCRDCNALLHVLTALAGDLPALREVQPDPTFVSDVLARTRPRRRPRATWVVRLAREWRSLIQRPRFAWEGAYIGALIVMLIFGTPNAPFADVPQKTIDLVKSSPVAELGEPVREIAPHVASSVEWAWQAARSGVIDTSSELAIEAAHGPSTLYEQARKILGTAWKRVTSFREKEDTHRPAGRSGSGEGEKR
jgi:anti-sigma factor RsiW